MVFFGHHIYVYSLNTRCILTWKAAVNRCSVKKLLRKNSQKSQENTCGGTCHTFKNPLKDFDNFKSKQNSVWSNVFWYVKVCIFWKCIQDTINWDKKQNVRKISLRQNKRYKKCPLFYFASSNSSQFYFEIAILIWAEGSFSKTVYGIFHFWFRFVFIKAYIFIQQNGWTLWL